MEICYGLSVHEKEEDWRVYKTIWEDAVTQAAEVDLAEVTSQNVGDESEQIHRKLTELNQEIQAEEERLEAERAKLVLEEKEREAAREETKEPEEDEIQIEKAEMALKDEKEGSEAPHSEEDVEAGGQDHPEDNQRIFAIDLASWSSRTGFASSNFRLTLFAFETTRVWYLCWLPVSVLV